VASTTREGRPRGSSSRSPTSEPISTFDKMKRKFSPAKIINKARQGILPQSQSLGDNRHKAPPRPQVMPTAPSLRAKEEVTDAATTRKDCDTKTVPEKGTGSKTQVQMGDKNRNEPARDAPRPSEEEKRVLLEARIRAQEKHLELERQLDQLIMSDRHRNLHDSGARRHDIVDLRNSTNPLYC